MIESFVLGAIVGVIIGIAAMCVLALRLANKSGPAHSMRDTKNNIAAVGNDFKQFHIA
jgi:hypothetical protein